jgi:hypothetical protein
LNQHLEIKKANNDNDPDINVALSALANLRGNETATGELARGFGTGADVKYWAAGGAINKAGSIPGLSAEILGPPKDISFFNRMDPPANQRYLTRAGGKTEEIHPFPGQEMKLNSPEFLTARQNSQPEALRRALTR